MGKFRAAVKKITPQWVKDARNAMRKMQKQRLEDGKNLEARRLYERDLQLYNSMVGRTGGGQNLSLCIRRRTAIPALWIDLRRRGA